MTVEIKYNDKIYEVIEVKNAYILTLNLHNKTERSQILNIDELQFDKPYIRLDRVLPNGGAVELLIIKTEEVLLEKYKGLINLSISFNGVTVESKL